MVKEGEIPVEYSEATIDTIVFSVGAWTALGSPTRSELKWPRPELVTDVNLINQQMINTKRVALDQTEIHDQEVSMRLQSPVTNYGKVVTPSFLPPLRRR